MQLKAADLFKNVSPFATTWHERSKKLKQTGTLV